MWEGCEGGCQSLRGGMEVRGVCIQSCVRVITSLLATWAVEQLGSETIGHLMTNASKVI